MMGSQSATLTNASDELKMHKSSRTSAHEITGYNGKCNGINKSCSKLWSEKVLKFMIFHINKHLIFISKHFLFLNVPPASAPQLHYKTNLNP